MIKSYIMDTDANEKVGQHFKVREFACKDGSQVVFIDSYLVSILDILRNQAGKPVIINSGYRTPARNKAVGGAFVYCSIVKYLSDKRLFKDLYLKSLFQKPLLLCFGFL